MKRGIVDLAHGTVVYGLGEVLSRAATFLLLPVFTAYLSPKDYGVISILSALTVFLTPVFSLGLGGGIAPTYFDRAAVSHRHLTINSAFTLLLISTSTLVIVGSIFSRALSTVLFQTDAYSTFIRIAVVTAAFTIAAIPVRQFFQFEERSKLYVAFSMTSIGVSTLLSVITVVFFRRGVRGMLEASLMGQAVALVLFAFPIVGWIRPRMDRAIVRELLRLSLPLVPAFACVFVLQNGNKYLLQWLGSLDEVGVYSVGLSIGTIVNVIVVAFQNAWVPYFMSFAEDQDGAKRLFGRVLTYYVYSMGGLTLALFAIARPLMMIMTRPAFHGAWRVVGLSATAQMLAGAASILLPGMYIAKEVQFIGLIQGAGGVAGVLMGVCLIPRYGVVGAALSLVFSYAVLIAVQFRWNRGRDYLDVQYEWRRLGLFACFFCVYAGISLWSRNFPVTGELGISSLLLLLIPPLIYAQLTGQERHELWTLPRRYLKGANLGNAEA